MRHDEPNTDFIMPSNTETPAAVSFREKKRAYVEALHTELGLTRRFQVGFFAAEFLLNASALQAAYPKSRSHSHLDQYFERRQAALEADVGAGHWKVSCYQALRRDFLSGRLDWATSPNQSESSR